MVQMVWNAIWSWMMNLSIQALIQIFITCFFVKYLFFKINYDVLTLISIVVLDVINKNITAMIIQLAINILNIKSFNGEWIIILFAKKNPYIDKKKSIRIRYVRIIIL